MYNHEIDRRRRLIQRTEGQRDIAYMLGLKELEYKRLIETYNEQIAFYKKSLEILALDFEVIESQQITGE